MATYHLFISHSWRKNNLYQKLCNLLDARGYFKWKDYSVPIDYPIHSGYDTKIREALKEQILHASCVLVIASMDVPYSDWIQEEIKIAKSMNKPIIGVKPQGQERISCEVQCSADKIVGWNTESIVEAIREYSL